MSIFDRHDPSTWPVVNWDSLESWPTLPQNQWPVEWDIQAKAALIRHFSRIPLLVEEDRHRTHTTWTLVLPETSRTPLRDAGDALSYLDGFLAGCEAMADRWHCIEKGTSRG